MTPSLPAWAAAALAAHALAAAGVALLSARMPLGFRRLSGIVWLARAAYSVGIPYLALMAGLATPAQFALGWPAWPTAAAVLPAFGAWLLGGALALGLFARAARRFYPPAVRPAVRRRAQWAQPWGFAFVLLDTFYLQSHWMFYRAAVADAYALSARDAVALAGLALAGLEWLLDPGWWRDMTRAGLWEDRVLVVALAVASASFYLMGANFIIMLAAHAVLWLGWLAALVWQARVVPPQAAETPA